MAVWGVCRCKDEADIIGSVVEHMLTQVDVILIADNASTDGTREILSELPVHLLDDPDIAYYQSQAMSDLAAEAGQGGADWIVPFDADEIWLARTGERIADALEALPDAVLVAQADLYDHVATAEDDDGDPVARMCWRRAQPTALRKVACRASPGLIIEQGNHAARFPAEPWPPTVTDMLTVRHFPYRSAEQMTRKARNGAAAYAATNLSREVGRHWRDYGRLSDEQIAETFHTYFWSPDPDADSDLVLDPCPALSRS